MYMSRITVMLSQDIMRGAQNTDVYSAMNAVIIGCNLPHDTLEKEQVVSVAL